MNGIQPQKVAGKSGSVADGTPPRFAMSEGEDVCQHKGPQNGFPFVLAGIRTPAKKIFFAWLVENKGNPKKAKKAKRATSGEVWWFP